MLSTSKNYSETEMRSTFQNQMVDIIIPIAIAPVIILLELDSIAEAIL